MDKQSRITTIVAAVSKRFNPEDILKTDRPNLQQWEHILRVHASERFGDPNFFTPEDDTSVDPADEKIRRSIIIVSTHVDLTYDLLELPSSADVFDHLMLKFCVVN